MIIFLINILNCIDLQFIKFSQVFKLIQIPQNWLATGSGLGTLDGSLYVNLFTPQIIRINNLNLETSHSMKMSENVYSTLRMLVSLKLYNDLVIGREDKKW